MSPAHKEKTPADGEGHKPFTTWIKEAKELEMENADDAVAEYKKIVKAYPLKEEGYDRLMILYRRNKNYQGEMAVIQKAIKTFEDKFGKPAKHLKGKKMLSLSKSILKSTGLADKKGNPKYQHQPIARWSKRKQLLEARLKNFSTN